MTGIQCAWLAGAVLALSAGSLAGTAPVPTPVMRDPPAHEVSREQATAMLHQRYGPQARVLRADESEQGGRRVFVFRLLSVNGRIWIVRIDAQSGSELP